MGVSTYLDSTKCSGFICYSCCFQQLLPDFSTRIKYTVKVLLLVILVLPQLLLCVPTREHLRKSWNSWQAFEKKHLPWMYYCKGPIGGLLDTHGVMGLFCPGPGPDVYDIFPNLPSFPGTIPPPDEKP